MKIQNSAAGYPFQPKPLAGAGIVSEASTGWAV